MAASSKSRRLNRVAWAVASGLTVMTGTADFCSALTINQWTGNAGDQSWNNSVNWLEGNVPNSSDQATVYNGFIQLTAAPPSVGGMLLSDVGSAAVVDTNGFKLNVLGAVNLDGGLIEALAAPSGSLTLQTPTLTLTDGGFLDMLSPSAHVHVSSAATGTATGVLSVDGTSTITMAGTLDTGTYTNNGTLNGNGTVNATTFTLAGTSTQTATISPNASVMTINAATFELHDPNSAINLTTAGSTLNLVGNIDYTSGYIGANISVGDTATLNFSGSEAVIGYYTKSGSTFIPHGNVTLAGGPTLARAAQITGEAAFESNVSVSGFASLPNGPEFDGASSITGTTGSALYLNGAYFRGTSTSSSIAFSGSGQVVWNGATNIGYSATGIAYTTVNVNAGVAFDWDGTSTTTASCTITNGELDIYSSSIDVARVLNPPPLGYYGALSVTGGALLNVAGTAWTLYGTMALGPGAIVQGQTLTFDGTNLSAGSYSLSPSYSGTTFPVIQAPVVLNPKSVIYMGFTGGLHLDGATTYAGGSVTSAPYILGNPPYGILVQDGNATVTANTTIFCDVLDMDGTADTATWTINAGALFTQQAFFLDAANSTSNPFHSTLTINGGALNMQTSGGIWTLAGGTINLNEIGFSVPYIEGAKLALGAGSVIGTINVGAGTTATITAPLQSTATTVAGGNVANIGASSTLYVYTFGSDANGVLTKTGPGKLTILNAQNYAAGSQLVVSLGELDLDTDAGANGANLNLNASGGLTYLYGTQHLSTLTVGSGARVIVPAQTTPNPRAVLVTTLNMSGGTLDLASNDLIARNGSLASITANLQTGFNQGNWTGVGGIVSSAAATDSTHLHALGVILNKSPSNTPIYSTFDNQASATTDVLVKYTYYGDATLDGKVDGSDYARIDAAYASHGSLTGWYNGDFNYDGVINGSDYALIDNAFNEQGAQISAVVSAAQIGSAVPEPISVTMIGIAAMGMLSRRPRIRVWARCV